MSEITKLYENAGIEPRRKCEFYEDCPLGFAHSCDDCDIEFRESNSSYPPFTSEKQLSIVKFLLGKSVYYDTYGDREYWFHISDEIENSKYREFDEAIAECINKMWEDLRDYEKVQIKEILK